MILNTIHTNKLKGVLAIYDKHVGYHTYDQKTLSNSEPLTEQTAKSLFNFLFDQDFAQNFFFKNIIPNNILKYKETKKLVIWYTKPNSKHLQFDATLPIQDGTYPIPYLIWKLEGNQLKIYASNKEPNKENTNLFHAPFLNISENREVCMGTANFTSKSNDYSKIIEKVENGFFNSIFTHTNHDNILANKESIVKMYNEQSNQNNKSFQYELLNPIKTTLKDICND